MKQFYKYKSFGDWCKGVSAKLLLDIGSLFNAGSMIYKAMDVGERLVHDYDVGDECALITFGFRGFYRE
jgi:hypothetical protein